MMSRRTRVEKEVVGVASFELLEHFLEHVDKRQLVPAADELLATRCARPDRGHLRPWWSLWQ